MLSWIILALGAYGAIIVCIICFQRHLMYYPVKTIAAPQVYGLAGVEDIFLTSFNTPGMTDNATQVQAWIHSPREGFPTIIYFHGNAFNLSDRAERFRAYVGAGFGLIAVSYRGFGKSAGRPMEQGIYGDARAAIDYALHTLHLPKSKIVYYGESLGSGVAVQMALEHPPGLLVLEAAYTSVATRSAELYPFVPAAKRLVRDKYDSLAKISKVEAPLLMLHGAKDPTIPLRHGQALFAAAREPKEMVVYPEVGHTNFSDEQILTPLIKAAKAQGMIEG